MPDIKDYKFADRPQAGSGNIDVLEAKASRLCEHLEAVISDMIAISVEVSNEDTKVQSFGDWTGSLDTFESISTYRLLPLKGNLLVHLNERMIAAFVDVYFGGTADRKNVRLKPVFREIEETIIDRFCTQLLEQFGGCLVGKGDLEAVHIEHESNPAYVDCFKFIFPCGRCLHDR